MTTKNGATITLGITILGVLATAITGGIWLGNVEAKAENALLAAGKVEAIKVDQAVIKEQIKSINREIIAESVRTNKKLDDLLKEILRRNSRDGR